MKKLLKFGLAMVAILVAVAISGMLYVSYALPNVGPPPQDLKVTATPEKIARGKYLAYHVLQCINHETLQRVGPSDFQTIMPWYMYAGMTEEDLSAIYTYLRTVTPVDNRVTTFKLARISGPQNRALGSPSFRNPKRKETKYLDSRHETSVYRNVDAVDVGCQG